MLVFRSLIVALVAGTVVFAGGVASGDDVVPQSIGRSLEKLRKEKKLKIAYFGGTANSWQTRTTAWFQNRDPQAKVTDVVAAAGGGSEYGAFRFRKDVAEQDPDLVFVEFAVDDAEIAEQRVLRGLEGIVRQFWTSNPWAELVFVYTTNRKLAAGYEQGRVPKAVGYHRAVAKHYGIPEIDIGGALAAVIRSGKASRNSLTAEGGAPTEAGGAIYFRTIESYLKAHASDPAAEPVVVLPDPLSKDPFSGAYVAKGTGLYAPGWSKVPKPADALPPYIEADAVGSELVHSFTGSTIGLLLVVGPDGGDIEWSIDDGPPQRLSAYEATSGTGPRLKFVILADNLSAGKEHNLTIRILPEKRPQATDRKIRLAAIMMHCDC